MVMNKLIAGAFALGLIAFPSNATVTVGEVEGANCFPFSCNYTGTYQQVYDSSVFDSPIIVDSIDFFTTERPGTLNTATYDLAFYYTDNNTDRLSAVFSVNRNEPLANFGTFDLAGTAQQTLSFDGNNFLYDPTLGNLLLEIRVSNLLAGGTSYQDAAFDSADLLSRVWSVNGDSSFAVTDSVGLVTRFNTIEVGAVPEPTTWAMMLLGFGLVGGIMRQRKNKVRVTHA